MMIIFSCITIMVLTSELYFSPAYLSEKYVGILSYGSGPPKLFARTRSSILGENIINCREFSLATPKTIEYVNSYKSFNSIPTLSLPEFAFIGRSNVGKSSLLNTLHGTCKKVATAGKTPGTTKCINVYACKDKSGPICSFVDLPGYGFAKLSKTEQDEISRFLRDYFLARGALKLVFLLVDSRRERSLLDEEMFTFLVDHGVTVAIVATKIDKLSSRETGKAVELIANKFNKLAAEAAAKFAQGEKEEEEPFTQNETEEGLLPQQVPVIPFSSVTGQGKSDLWKVIRDNIITTSPS